MDLHLSRAGVVGLVGAGALALVVSATTGAVADRLITSADIRDHTIVSQDLAAGSVSRRTVKEESITGAKLSPRLRARVASTGTAGPAGPAGPAGADGARGADGVSGYEIVEKTVTGPSGTIGQVDCPTGKRVLGGGSDPVTLNPGIGTNRPTPDGTGWVVQFFVAGPGDVSLRLYAICAEV